MRTDKYQKLRELIDVIVDEEATVGQIEQLKAMLKNNPDAQLFYYDYIGMHMHLKSAADQHVEFVYRRMSEEFIVRPTDKHNHSEMLVDANGIDGTGGNNNPTQSLKDASPTSNSFKPSKITLYILALISALLLTILVWFTEDSEGSPFTAKILQGQLSILEFGKIEDNLLSPGEYRIEQTTKLQLKDGDILDLITNSVIKIFNNNEIQLMHGALKIEPVSKHNILVHAHNFGIYTNGSSLSIDLTANQPIVKSGTGTLLTPKIWRPRHFWSFDGIGRQAIDLAGRADGVVSPKSTRVDGLVGQGAFLFDNTNNARINVGNGGASAPASGSFSVSNGVTIEAMIVPKYSGLPGDNDHIFRKDQTDGNLRMLLSFQNDQGKKYLRPKGEFNESISFGLFLLGQNYQELKLPLDGKSGRPTLEQLKDGNPHHIVATYDADTGYKAIYLDGKKLASYKYPIGSKILSGGQGMAHIGNNPNPDAGDTEAFNGIIDEVAFYNYALPPYMVKYHLAHVNKGLNYFGLFSGTKQLPATTKIPLPDHTKLAIDASTGLPYKVLN